MDDEAPPARSNVAPPPPPPPVPVQPLEYRSPGAGRNPQWWTDDQPGRVVVILGLLVVTGLGSVVAAMMALAFYLTGC